jgi:hypothetical protein
LRCEDRHGVKFLYLTLPSGRDLAYPFVKLVENRFGFPAVSFMDNSLGKWVEYRQGQGAYGGTFFENVVLGVARDLLAAAMLRLEAAGYPVVLHVHDEIVCEVPDGFGSVEEYQRIVEQPPDWAEGCPVGAKVRNGPRFASAETPVEHIASAWGDAPRFSSQMRAKPKVKAPVQYELLPVVFDPPINEEKFAGMLAWAVEREAARKRKVATP